MDYKYKKKLLNTFVIVYLLVFLVFNWEDVSWLFNYKFIQHLFAEIPQKGAGFLSNAASEFFQTENNGNKEKKVINNRENSIEIPKIGVSAPLIIGKSSEPIDLEEDLKRGVVYFPDSVLPGEQGQTIILGHSASQNWPKINYDWVFSELNSLEKNDNIIIYFNEQKYAYFVNRKIFLDRGEEVPKGLTNSDNVLILVSCWPPGSNFKRIAVEAEISF